jgi:hypothetical protein
LQGLSGGNTNWLGTWSSATTYAQYDAIAFNGSSYIALSANTNQEPDTQPTYWQLLAAAGATGRAGATGAAGSTGAQGPAGIIWTGAWNVDSTYIVSDGVNYGGSSYIAILASDGSAPKQPDVQPTYWSLLAQKGDTGSAGATGATGAAGATGADGASALVANPNTPTLTGLGGWTGTLVSGSNDFQGAVASTAIVTYPAAIFTLTFGGTYATPVFCQYQVQNFPTTRVVFPNGAASATSTTAAAYSPGAPGEPSMDTGQVTFYSCHP